MMGNLGSNGRWSKHDVEPGRRHLSGARGIGLILGCTAIQGCILLAAIPFSIQNEFDDKRAGLKIQVEKGTIPRDAGEAECRRMLDQVGRGMTGPPPISPNVCTFGSFADKRYELTILVQQRKISPESWVRECQSFPDKPASEEACRYDPIGEQVVEWKRMIASHRISQESAQFDCQKVLSAAQAGQQQISSGHDVCRF
jgi:hypothetical protein